MSSIIDVEKEWLRKVISGKITFKKCLCCDNNGREYWDENGVSVLPYPHPDWGEDYCDGPCQNCDGIGFVENA